VTRRLLVVAAAGCSLLAQSAGAAAATPAELRAACRRVKVSESFTVAMLSAAAGEPTCDSVPDPEMIAGWPGVQHDAPSVYWQVLSALHFLHDRLCGRGRGAEASDCAARCLLAIVGCGGSCTCDWFDT
jgi:hypothetical protein